MAEEEKKEEEKATPFLLEKAAASVLTKRFYNAPVWSWAGAFLSLVLFYYTSNWYLIFRLLFVGGCSAVYIAIAVVKTDVIRDVELEEDEETDSETEREVQEKMKQYREQRNPMDKEEAEADKKKWEADRAEVERLREKERAAEEKRQKEQEEREAAAVEMAVGGGKKKQKKKKAPKKERTKIIMPISLDPKIDPMTAELKAMQIPKRKEDKEEITPKSKEKTTPTSEETSTPPGVKITEVSSDEESNIRKSNFSDGPVIQDADESPAKPKIEEVFSDDEAEAKTDATFTTDVGGNEKKKHTPLVNIQKPASMQKKNEVSKEDFEKFKYNSSDDPSSESESDYSDDSDGYVPAQKPKPPPKKKVNSAPVREYDAIFAAQCKKEGNEHFCGNRLHLAISCYTDAIDFCPPDDKNDLSVYFGNRAAARMRMEDYEKVIADCTMAIQYNESYVKAISRRSQAYEKTEKWHDALEDVKKLCDLDPSEKMKQFGRIKELERKSAIQMEKDKEQMIGQLKDLGDMVLGKFGMSMDNFAMQKDPDTGQYSFSMKS